MKTGRYIALLAAVSVASLSAAAGHLVVRPAGTRAVRQLRAKDLIVKAISAVVERA
jgi:hypothetical protein